MGLLGLVKFGVAMARGVRAGNQQAEALRRLPMADLVPALVGALGTPAPPGPCSAIDLQQWQQAHPTALPPELLAFYAVANGLPAGEMGWPAVFPLGKLGLAERREPPFRAELLADWEEWGREQGDPRGLKVMRPSLADLATDNHERVLPFSDTDDMLVLWAADPGRAILMVAAPHPYLPVGTVLDVENLIATRYAGLQDWLASVAGMLGRLQGMQAAAGAKAS